MSYYGREAGDWEQLTAEGLDYLEDLAAHRLDASYGKLNGELARRTGLRPFNFDLDAERAAMGELLGQISEASYAGTGVLISAIVHHVDGDDNPGPGKGFYGLAQKKGLIRPGLSRVAKFEWWVGYVGVVHARYSQQV